MNTYRKHAHNRSVGWSTWHIEWCTKYRYKIFGYVDRKSICKILLRECAKSHNFEIYDLEVDVDHVHVIASLPLTMTPSRASMYMKGDTARGLFIEFPELRRIYHCGHLWSPGKFIGSVGHITLEKAKKYLEAHHAKSLVGIPAFRVAKSCRRQSFRAGRMSNS